jgi:hypothetical protein
MTTVSQTSPYYTRLLTKLNDQETAIETLQSEVDEVQRTYNRQRQELETSSTNTTVARLARLSASRCSPTLPDAA